MRKQKPEIDKTQAAINRGARAKALIEDELLNEALDNLKEQYIGAWSLTSPLQTDVRERLWQAVQVVGKVRDHLTVVLNDGKIAQAEVNRMVEAEKTKKGR